MEKITSETLRNFNRRQIYNYIFTQKRTSRQAISDDLNLSLPTVTQNLKLLEEENLIERCGFFQSTGGRKCVAYGCVSTARVAIGAHITAHGLRLVAVDMYGSIIKRQQISVDYKHSDEYYIRFGEYVSGFVKSLNISQKRVLGVGIALTALLSRDRKHVAKSLLLGTAEAGLADFQEHVPFPCQLFHDSEAAADAELWFSPGINDALYLGINYHLNGMLIVNRKIHVGKEYTGGLVEHLTLYPGGRKCYCGKKGCFTTYCSGHVLYDEEGESCEKFFARLRDGDKEATAKWQRFLEDLAIEIGNLSALLDCDIILGGTVGAYMTEEDRLLLQQMVRSDFHYAPSSDFICLGYKDVDICACGAALAYVEEFVKSI